MCVLVCMCVRSRVCISVILVVFLSLFYLLSVNNFLFFSVAHFLAVSDADHLPHFPTFHQFKGHFDEVKNPFPQMADVCL